MAVGGDGDGIAAFAYQWNGTGWTQRNPLGTTGSLYAVSCTASTACIAVGAYYYGTGGTVQFFNGTGWSAQANTFPDAAHAVTCALRSACTAVGSASGGPFAARNF
jgi:hypothetical protein